MSVTAGAPARVGSSLWVSTNRVPADSNELVRVDTDDGKATQRINFGFDVPETLAPVGKDLWVITSGGKAMLVSPG